MATAEAVARYFLWLAAQEPEPEPVTHLRLQKLLYYAQGSYMGKWREPLFPDRIEAWPHGPVVASVYPLFADHGRDPIPPHDARSEPSLTHEERALIEWVWATYGGYSASRLRAMSHTEPPWKSARAGLSADNAGAAPIPTEAIGAFFRAQHEAACRKCGIDPDELDASLADCRAGRTIPWEEIVKEFAGDLAH
jgi:uncharacterized phage-associated protein